MQQPIWQPLEEELNLWHQAGLTPQFWWRDDDASKAGLKLKKLADVSAGLPVCLAVVPNWLDQTLAPWLDKNFDNATILQHGWEHVNHAGPKHKKCEFSNNRQLGDCLHEITNGHALLIKTFNDRYQPVFVPPWNRISDKVIKALPSVGHLALSVYGPRTAFDIPPRRLNTHVDIINWQKGRGFIGMANAIGLCVEHLRAKRQNRPNVDATEPTGILSHHIDHDNGCWEFLEELVKFSAKHQLKWVTPIEVIL